MPTRRFSPMSQLSAGWVHLRPRLRRPQGTRGPGGRNRKLPIAVAIIGTVATGGYIAWQRHIDETNPLHIGVGPHIIAKSESPNIVPLPGTDTAPTPGRDLLARAQLENELLYTDLQSFVCNESIQRYRGPLDSDTGRPVDTVTAKVSFEDGVERYSDIFQNRRARPSLSSIPGAWSEGEFGTLLRQTHALLGTQTVKLKGDSTMDDQAAAIYTIDVDAQDSPWSLMISGRPYKIPFRTDVWVSRETGRILQIERTSTSIPPGMGISELRWSVKLDPVQLSDKTWLLPKSGEYEVQYADSKRREWNVMTFSDYQRYGSRVILHF